MLFEMLLVFHIAVLGYWLGAELVINATYRYVSYRSEMPFPERKRLMEHVMHADQHVRYALVLQAGLGTVLAALLGYFPGGTALAWAAAAAGVAWLALVEVTHRARHRPAGQTLARIDRLVRYVLLAALVVLGIAGLVSAGTMPNWLAGKLVLFAGAIACGVGIRLALIRFFALWREIEAQGSDEARERRVRRIYVGATSILVGLWLCIAGIVVLSVLKP